MYLICYIESLICELLITDEIYNSTKPHNSNGTVVFVIFDYKIPRVSKYFCYSDSSAVQLHKQRQGDKMKGDWNIDV